MSKKETTIDDLALMVKKGFDGVTEEINVVREEIKTVNQKVDKLAEKNENDHEDIKLRLNNVAYRFEFEDLKKRVTRLEETVKPA